MQEIWQGSPSPLPHPSSLNPCINSIPLLSPLSLSFIPGIEAEGTPREAEAPERADEEMEGERTPAPGGTMEGEERESSGDRFSIMWRVLYSGDFILNSAHILELRIKKWDPHVSQERTCGPFFYLSRRNIIILGEEK